MSALIRTTYVVFAVALSACCNDYEYAVDVDRTQEPFLRSCDELCAEIFVVDDTDYAGCIDATREDDGIPVARCIFTGTYCQPLL